MRLKTSFVTAAIMALTLGCASAKKSPDANSAQNTAGNPAASGAADTNLTPKTRAHKKKPADTKLAARDDSAAGASPTPEPGPSASGAKSMTCKAGADERKLDIVSANGGCKLNYTKEGASKEIANQSEGDAKCAEVLDRITKKLTDAGYDCK